MNRRNAPIGVFDSGMGGFGVARLIRQELPLERMEYIGDTLHRPYGPRPQAEVRSFVLAIGDFLVGLGVKAIVVACNTASAAALETLREEHPDIHVLGMIQPGVDRALEVTKNGRIGVVGTLGTIDSSVHQRALVEKDPGVKVFPKACPDLLRIGEQGGTDDTEYLYDLARRSLAPLVEEQIDTLVLGCTDFTCIRDAVDPAVPEGVEIVDPALQVTMQLKELLADHDELNTAAPGQITHRFWVTGGDEEHFAAFGEKFMGIPIPEVHTAPVKWRE